MERRIPILVLTAAVGAGVVGSCGGDGNGSDTTEPPTHGDVRVTVTRDGAAAAGVGVALYAPGGSTPQATASTSAAGVATFGNLEPGAREVEVPVPDGVEVTNGPARRAVSVTAGATAEVTFALATTGGSDVVEVVMTAGLQFSPSDLTISVGQTVRWRNEVAMFHTITPDGHSEWSEGSVSGAGQTFTHTFTSSGNFPYYCAPHRTDGMTGVIRVQ